MHSASVVDYGLAHNTLGVKILFRPGSTAFEAEAQTTGPYDMWLRADRRSQREPECLPSGDRQQQPVGVRRAQRSVVGAARRVCVSSGWRRMRLVCTGT